MYTNITAKSLSGFDQTELQSMLAAGEEIQESYRVLKKANLNVVGECMKNQGEFVQLTHYPKGDVYDDETHYQYYYHNHRGIEGEHGHFHTFLRSAGMTENMQPLPWHDQSAWPLGDEAVSHIIAISMDKFGYPVGLFAVNRWVTGETWYRSEHVKQMADHFEIDHAWPNWPVNRWITGMFRLFRPEIRALLDHRDKVVYRWQLDHGTTDTFEDRELEVTGYTMISVENRILEIRKALESQVSGKTP